MDPVAYKAAYENTENPLVHMTNGRKTASPSPLLRHYIAEEMDRLVGYEMKLYLEEKWVEQIITGDVADLTDLFSGRN